MLLPVFFHPKCRCISVVSILLSAQWHVLLCPKQWPEKFDFRTKYCTSTVYMLTCILWCIIQIQKLCYVLPNCSKIMLTHGLPGITRALSIDTIKDRTWFRQLSKWQPQLLKVVGDLWCHAVLRKIRSQKHVDLLLGKQFCDLDL